MKTFYSIFQGISLLCAICLLSLWFSENAHKAVSFSIFLNIDLLIGLGCLIGFIIISNGKDDL